MFGNPLFCWIFKINSGLNKKIGSFQLFYNYNAMKPGMTTPAALTLVNKNERKNEYWYQDLTNHILSSKSKMFFGRYKIGANLAWQYNKRKLHTDEKNEVNMGLNVLSYDVKTWLPSAENTEYIIGLQGALKKNKSYQVIIYGYTDSIGDKIKNKLLSQRRANAIKEGLMSHGISATKLTAIGKGEANPIADNMYAKGREKNRRIEIELIK